MNSESIDMPVPHCINCGTLKANQFKREGEDKEGFPVQVCVSCEAEISWD